MVDRIEKRRKAMYLNYKLLKGTLDADAVLAALSIQAKRQKEQIRATCKACCGNEGNDLTVNPKLKSFYCHTAKVGGSLIDLAAHTFGCEFREAAEFLAEFTGNPGKTSALPSHQRRQQPSRSPAAAEPERPEEFAALGYLVYEHELVQQAGLSPGAAEAMGCGYAPKGTYRGKVVAPAYANGIRLGYFTLGDNAVFHRSLNEKVIPFQKKAG
jgi:DNA primase